VSSKGSLTVFICLSILIMGLYRPNDGRGQPKQKIGIDRDSPIEIASDRLDAYNDRRIVVFSGNAVATQGGLAIRSDRLTLHYRDQQKPTNQSSGEPGDAGNLESVEAKGHVVITEGERAVTGDEAVFDQDSRKITMTGNAVMREGDNVIRGDRIVVFLNENRGVVESTESKRVTATIYPGKQQQDKKR
jgi:lipopolysaccharide export system protein LptA